jgi:hypothetical protein
LLLDRRILPLVVVLGCGGDPQPQPNTHCSGFVGDKNLAPEIELLTIDPEGAQKTMDDGGRIALIEPPQGGRVVFAGVRARNLDTCPLKLTGVLRNTDTDKIALEKRPVNFLAADDGWAYAEQPMQISSYTNVAVCPNEWSTKNINDTTYELEVQVEDKAGRTATKKAMVTPYCGEPDKAAVCACICHVDYKLGQCPGDPDAGP